MNFELQLPVLYFGVIEATSKREESWEVYVPSSGMKMRYTGQSLPRTPILNRFLLNLVFSPYYFQKNSFSPS